MIRSDDMIHDLIRDRSNYKVAPDWFLCFFQLVVEVATNQTPPLRHDVFNCTLCDSWGRLSTFLLLV